MQRMEESNIRASRSSGDADVLICTTAIQLCEFGPTHIIGEDTDLLVILLHHASRQTIPPGALFRKNNSKNAKHKVWDIGHTCRVLGGEKCHLLPFVHAITGCDTTSRLFKIGKGKSVEKLSSCPLFRKQALSFCSPTMPDRATVIDAGVQSIALLYGGKPGEHLDKVRARKFKKATLTSTTEVEVKNLPPTSDAAKYHSLRVFFSSSQLDWGWKCPRSNRMGMEAARRNAAPSEDG